MKPIDADKYREEMFASRDFNFFSVLDMQPTLKVIPVPDSATNGDMMKMMFPKMVIRWVSSARIGVTFVQNQKYITEFDMKWWNAPFKVVS